MSKILVGAFALLATTSVLAGVPPFPPTELPTPGTFGLFAMAGAALVIVTRLKRRK